MGVVLTFKSVDEILWCNHSNETSLAVLLHGTIWFSIFYKNKFWNFSWILIFGTLGSSRANTKCVSLVSLQMNVKICFIFHPAKNAACLSVDLIFFFVIYHRWQPKSKLEKNSKFYAVKNGSKLSVRCADCMLLIGMLDGTMGFNHRLIPCSLAEPRLTNGFSFARGREKITKYQN